LDTLDGQVVELEKALKEKEAEIQMLKAKIEELEADKPKDLDPEIAEERAADVTDRVDRLVEMGRIPERVAASLKNVLIGTDGARNGYMLSRSNVVNSKGVKPIRA